MDWTEYCMNRECPYIRCQHNQRNIPKNDRGRVRIYKDYNDFGCKSRGDKKMEVKNDSR